MSQFPHLRFIQKITGKPRLFGGGSVHDKTLENKKNRKIHSDNLFRQTSKITEDWSKNIQDRELNKLAPLSEDIIPIYLQINPDLIGSDFDLQSLGIEIISEEDDGYIIGASLDAMKSLNEKIAGFLNEDHGTATIADLWQIIEGNREAWKPRLILSDELFAKWGDIKDDEGYKFEVGIAFDTPMGKEPDPAKKGLKRLERYRQLQIDRDERLMERENHFDKFIANYGNRLSDLIHLEDSFVCEVEISGRGVKDLVFNYPFVFEVAELEVIGGDENNIDGESNFELEILVPEATSPEIGVIDSGIMEDHRYIGPAIIKGNSKSYVDGDISTADRVKGGGHGTRVAGAILYPKGVTGLTSPYELPCFIRNIRVLDDNNSLLHKLPAELMKKLVDENEDCTVFNLSITSKSPYRKKHMSSWAATIDSIIYGKNVLFIISAGNILRDAIRYYLNIGESYPKYLQNQYSRLANPAQSSFALTVGSLNHAHFEDADWKSMGDVLEISAFSRIGLGIWGEIKPDVVEFGGGLNVSKNGGNLVRENESTSPELVRSTFGGGAAYSKDAIGTSYSAPKVTHIVAKLKKLYPHEDVNLLRALVIQGARLPNHFFLNPTLESIQHFGYGLPSLERVTENFDQRISYYNTGELKAEEGHIYLLKIPDKLLNQGDEYDILIEVTLAYTAKVRRTRQKTKSYLSTWLDWTTSKIDESFDDFKEFVLKEIENTVTNYDKEARKKLEGFPWKITDRDNRGEVIDVNRNNSTAQKDWAIIKSYQLPKELSFAVRAHKGWDQNMEEVPYALTVSIEVLNVNIPIYESIRIENEIEITV